jgi:hypothetical protein
MSLMQSTSAATGRLTPGQFDKIALAIFAAEPDGQITYVNDLFSRIMDIKERSVECCATLSDLEDLLAIELQAPASRIIAGEPSFQSEQFIFTSTSGKFYLLSITLTPLEVNGAAVGVFGVIHDLTETADASENLKRRIGELNIIEEISRALHSTMKTEDILRMILAAATCKEGLGFNRAFLFLGNEKTGCLEGKVAIGPSTPEEAGRIWYGIDQQPRRLIEVLERYLENVANYDIEANRIVQSLKIDLNSESTFRKVVESGRWRVFGGEDDFEEQETEVTRFLNTRHFAVVPLLSRGKTIGIILADNLITGKAIEDNVVRLLQIFADHAASAIEHAKLFEELENKALSLENANRKLAQVQRQVAAIEKSSLFAEVTYKIAHELRNPITIMGGFASLLNRNLDPADNLGEYARIIMEETLRVEKALTDVLNFSKSFAEDRVNVDLAEVVKATVDVLEQTHTACTVEVDYSGETTPRIVRVNRDQSVQSLHDIIETFNSYLPKGTAIKLRLGTADGVHRIELHLETDRAHREMIDKFLKEMLKTQVSGSSLRMTLAFETIRYNGGEPGIAACASGDKYLYIEYPIMEESYG